MIQTLRLRLSNSSIGTPSMDTGVEVPCCFVTDCPFSDHPVWCGFITETLAFGGSLHVCCDAVGYNSPAEGP